MKKIIWVIMALLLVSVVSAVYNITLVDVSKGYGGKRDACIFKINGKTAVVQEDSSQKVDGIRIYVYEVLVIHSGDMDSDVCKATITTTEDGNIEDITYTAVPGEGVEKEEEENGEVKKNETIENKTNETEENKTEIIFTPTPVVEEKTFFQKFLEWLRGLFR